MSFCQNCSFDWANSVPLTLRKNDNVDILAKFQRVSLLCVSNVHAIEVLLPLQENEMNKFDPSFFFFLLGTRQDSTDLLAVYDLTYLRDSLTNIRIRVLSPGRPSFRENAS